MSSVDKTQWDNATRLKTAKLSNGNIVIVYEVWSSATYKRTEYMVIDSLGGVVTPSTFIPYALRLAPQDPAVMLYDDIVTIVGYDGLSLVRYHIQLGGDQCYESVKDRYYVKTDTDGEEITKKCGSLAKKNENKVKWVCAKTKSGTTGAAKDVCKVTCGVCPCGEIDKSRFYPRPVKGEERVKNNKCSWLASTKKDIESICTSDRRSDKFGPAKVVCPVTCGTCPNE